MTTPRDRWTSILRDFDRSGLTAVRFCARRKISRSSFHRWRTRLGRRPAPAFVEALPPVSALGGSSPLTIELRCGRRISVSDGFDDLALARAIVLLKRIDSISGAGL
jgi:hypothetical protein